MFLHFFMSGFYFQLQFSCGHTQHTGAQTAQLHQRIGRGHTDIVVIADFRHQRFDIGITGFALFCVDHLNIVELALLAKVTLLLVAIKHHHKAAFGKACVTA